MRVWLTSTEYLSKLYSYRLAALPDLPERTQSPPGTNACSALGLNIHLLLVTLAGQRITAKVGLSASEVDVIVPVQMVSGAGRHPVTAEHTWTTPTDTGRTPTDDTNRITAQALQSDTQSRESENSLSVRVRNRQTASLSYFVIMNHLLRHISRSNTNFVMQSRKRIDEENKNEYRGAGRL